MGNLYLGVISKGRMVASNIALISMGLSWRNGQLAHFPDGRANLVIYPIWNCPIYAIGQLLPQPIALLSGLRSAFQIVSSVLIIF